MRKQRKQRRHLARVSWARRLTDAEAAAITIKRVLGGADGWVP